MLLKTHKVYKLSVINIKHNNKLTKQPRITLPTDILTRGWQQGDLIKVMLDEVNPTVIILKNMSLEERLRKK